MDNIENLVFSIEKIVREKEEEFIIETIYPYAKKKIETHILKEELKKAIQAYYEKDVQEVIRCKDCKHRDPEDKRCDGVFCAKHGMLPMDDDDYCSYGERKKSLKETTCLNCDDRMVGITHKLIERN